MKKFFLLTVLAILLSSVSALAFNAEPIKKLVDGYNVKACSFALSNNGKVEFSNYGAEITENSVFELASNGKIIAAYITLSLVDEGKLNLEDKIAPYLDDKFITRDPRLNDITVKQLLSHTAGFSPSYELGVDKKIYSDPGTEFRYSGVGYIYLQNVIESISGMSMEQAARQYVFEPLGMKNSTYEAAKTVTPYMNLSSAVLYSLLAFIVLFTVVVILVSIIGKVTGFKYFSLKTIFVVSVLIGSIINILFLLFIFVSKVLIIFLVYLAAAVLVLLFTVKNNKMFYMTVPVLTVIVLLVSFIIPITIPVINDVIDKNPNCAYSLKSTSQDMALFCDRLMLEYNNESSAVKGMFEPAVRIDNENSWGLGIAVETGSQGTTFWHSGINPGFQSLIVLYPEQYKYAIALTNSDNGLNLSKAVVRDILGVNGVWDIKR